MRNIWRNEKPIANPAMIAAIKIPLPVAESQFNLKIASSGLVGFSNVGSGTIGGGRLTLLCSNSIVYSGAETCFNFFFISGKPQIKINSARSSHGNQAKKSFLPFICGSLVSIIVSPAAGNFPLVFGFQNRSTTTTPIRETIADPQSTSHGPS